MAKKKQGRVIIVFLVITAILMGTLAAIAVFFFRLEFGERKAAEARIEEFAGEQQNLHLKIDELEKASFLLQEKNKEADERINSLLDELDLQEGLRDEMKNEIAEMKEKLVVEAEAKDKMRKQMAKLEQDYETRIDSLNQQLRQENDKFNDLKTKYNDLLNGKAQMSLKAPAEPQEIKEIEGVVINVDEETQFVIVDIGIEEGLTVGQLLSVYRNNTKIGDIKITRVQDGMSAADPVAPLGIDAIETSDRVILQ